VTQVTSFPRRLVFLLVVSCVRKQTYLRASSNAAAGYRARAQVSGRTNVSPGTIRSADRS
jgi:hypothetical protein